MSKAGERLSKHLSPEEQAELMASMQAIAAAPMRMRDKQVMLRVQPVLLRAATDPDLGPALQGFMSRGKAVPTMSELGMCAAAAVPHLLARCGVDVVTRRRGVGLVTSVVGTNVVAHVLGSDCASVQTDKEPSRAAEAGPRPQSSHRWAPRAVTVAALLPCAPQSPLPRS